MTHPYESTCICDDCSKLRADRLKATVPSQKTLTEKLVDDPIWRRLVSEAAGRRDDAVDGGNPSAVIAANAALSELLGEISRQETA